MKPLIVLLLTCLCLAAAHTASAVDPIIIKVATEEVTYAAGDVTMKGFLAYPDVRNRKSPAVIVVHEWWGHDDYARNRAKQLAKMGYVALAVDMYGDGRTALHPDDAKKFASETTKNFDVAKSRFTAAMNFVKQQPQVVPDKIAAIGYCFGGGVVLNMARQGADLRGVASFHGSLAAAKPAEKGAVKAKIIVFNGEDDAMISAEQISAFRQEMAGAGVDYTFINYPGTRHSFTNPAADRYAAQFNMDLAYNKKADKLSWAELQRFLKKVFSTSTVKPRTPVPPPTESK